MTESSLIVEEMHERRETSSERRRQRKGEKHGADDTSIKLPLTRNQLQLIPVGFTQSFRQIIYAQSSALEFPHQLLIAPRLPLRRWSLSLRLLHWLLLWQIPSIGQHLGDYIVEIDGLSLVLLLACSGWIWRVWSSCSPYSWSSAIMRSEGSSGSRRGRWWSVREVARVRSYP